MPKKTSDIDFLDKIAIMLTGIPGDGKTVAAASFPGPVLILDIDRRAKPVRKMFPDRKDIYYEPFDPLSDWARFETYCTSLEGRGDYKTIILDSITSLGRMAINYHLTERNPKAVGAGTKIQNPDWPEWKFEDRAVYQTLSFLRTKCGATYFIVNAHLTEYTRTVINKETQQEEQRVYRRIVTGMKFLAAELPAYFDEMYFIEKTSGGLGGQGVFRVYTNSTADTPAKTALPLPKVMDVSAPDTLFGQMQKELAKYQIKLGEEKK